MARLLPLILLALLFVPAAARADDWNPDDQSCVSTLSTVGCTVTTSIAGARDVAVSPDGRFAYVIGVNDDSLVTFSRNPSTGALTREACISQLGFNGCAPGGPLNQPTDVEISPDGKQVYVAVEGGVTMFDRDDKGGLSHQLGTNGCVQRSAAPGLCTPVDGIDAGLGPAPTTLRLSPGSDPTNLYVATGNGVIVTLDRNPANGVLSAKAGDAGCARDGGAQGCLPTVGLGTGDIRQLAVSPDGRHLYAPATANGGAVVFNRGAGGKLTQRAELSRCITTTGEPVAAVNRCQADARLGGVAGSSVELSPDGAQLYVGLNTRVVVLARDAASGSLSFASCVERTGDDGCATGVRNLRNVGPLAFSADGEDLIATSEVTFAGLTFLHRDAAGGGRLTQTAGPDGCVTADGRSFNSNGNVDNSCREVPAATGLGSAGFVNGNQFYAGFQGSSAVVAFKRDFFPRCADQSLTVAQDTALAVPLACSDRNGDALSFTILGQPTAGQLGAIDAPGARVFYNPFGGFSGTDSFRYRATSGGRASNTATANLTVVAAPAPAPGFVGLDADRDGFFAGQDCNDANAAIRPGTLEIRGNRVDENCDGLAEPFPTVTSGVSAKWDLKGAKLDRFTLAQLTISNPLKGAKFEFRCAGRGCPLRSKKLSGKVRRGLLNARPSLGKKVKYRAGQTIEVRISASGFNTKVAQIKLRAGKTPSVVALCLPPGASKPQKTCT
jgi:DNA-binding beta-propeller fold protein YncE